MNKKIKYKQLIRKLQKFADDDVVIVASEGEVTFYSQDEQVLIASLSEFFTKKGEFKTTFYGQNRTT